MKSAPGFFKLALCSLILLGRVSCAPATVQISYPATPTMPTLTLAPPTSTADLSILWSATPDILSTLPPPASNTVWTSTPGWLTPPSPTFTPSDIPTATIIFDTPKPGQEQGVRGAVSYSGGGPADENGNTVSLGNAGGVRVFVLDSATKQLVAETVSGTTADSFGLYEISLLPGRYDVCIHSFHDICTQGTIVTAGNYVTLDFGIAME